MARTLQELIFHWHTAIEPLQNLRSVLNLKKSVLESSQTIKFLGVIINFIKMDISLPQMKLVKLIALSKQIYESKEIPIKELTQLLRILGATAQAILSGKLQIRYLQPLQINALTFSGAYQTKLQLDWEVQASFFGGYEI